MNCQIKTIVLSCLLLGVTLSSPAQSLRKLIAYTQQGATIEFYSKVEELIEEEEPIPAHVSLTPSVAEQPINISAFRKPEKELDEPLDWVHMAGIATENENPQAK